MSHSGLKMGKSAMNKCKINAFYFLSSIYFFPEFWPTVRTICKKNTS